MSKRILTTTVMLGGLVFAEQSHALHPPKQGESTNPSPEHTREREPRARLFRPVVLHGGTA